MVEAYPLQWPAGWRRTDSVSRERARFSELKSGQFGKMRKNVSYESATQELYNELKLLGAQNPVLSSNLQLRKDGIPYADQRTPADPGVAIYFQLKKKDQCIPCDKWDRPQDNIKAIAKTIEALRGIDRWGAKEMVDAAFRGFTALPAPDMIITTAPDYFGECTHLDQVEDRFRNLAKELHPDKGGSDAEFVELKRQYDLSKSRFA